MDYEQSLLVRQTWNKTRENAHARDWRRARLAALPLDACTEEEEMKKKRETARSL